MSRHVPTTLLREKPAAAALNSGIPISLKNLKHCKEGKSASQNKSINYLLEIYDTDNAIPKMDA